MHLSDWSALASALVSASATLIGLVFVAVSINLRPILAAVGLTSRAVDALLQFFQVFLIATILLVPGLRLGSLGVVCLLVGASSWIFQMLSWAKSIRIRKFLGGTRAVVVRNVILQASTLPFCIGGVLLLRGDEAGLRWLVPGFLFSFAGGLIGAWVLLVEILR